MRVEVKCLHCDTILVTDENVFPNKVINLEHCGSKMETISTRQWHDDSLIKRSSLPAPGLAKGPTTGNKLAYYGVNPKTGRDKDGKIPDLREELYKHGRKNSINHNIKDGDGNG